MVHVVCPHCGTVNRVPADRPAGQAVCGGCKAKLFDGRPVEVDAGGFEHHLRANDIPVLVDVWAPWCGPCRAMASEFVRAAAMLEPKMRLLKLNSDEHPAIASRYGVRGIPALLLFRDGRLAAQTAGAMAATQIAGWARHPNAN